MSALGRSSGWIAAVVALVICVAPSSFGQSARWPTTSSSLAGFAPWVSAIPGELTLQPTPLALISEPLQYDAKKKKKGGGGSGQPVPEGGSPFIYVGLAGLVCLGAVFLRHRRRKQAERSASS